MVDGSVDQARLDDERNRTRVMLVITAAADRAVAHTDVGGIDRARSFRSLATGQNLREWVAHLADAKTAHEAIEAALNSIETRRADFDRAIEVIRQQDPEATVGLAIWQDVDASHGVGGFYLSSDLIAWLARHGGSVDVDQGIEPTP